MPPSTLFLDFAEWAGSGRELVNATPLTSSAPLPPPRPTSTHILDFAGWAEFGRELVNAPAVD